MTDLQKALRRVKTDGNTIIGFDIDGVLVDSLEPVRVAFQTYATEYGLQDKITMDYARYNCMVGTPTHIVKTFLTIFQKEISQTSKADVLKVLDNDDLLEVEARKWGECYAKVDILPKAQINAIKLLVELRRKGYIVVLITSGVESELNKNLAELTKCHTNLVASGQIKETNEPYYDVTVCYDEVIGKGKPDLMPMKVALQKLVALNKLSQTPNLPFPFMFVGDGLSDIEFANSGGGIGVYIESTTAYNHSSGVPINFIFKDINHLAEEFSKALNF